MPLKGDQHKLDLNNNGKIDKQDFKMLNKKDYGKKLAEYGRKMMMQGMRLVKENEMGSKLYQNGTSNPYRGDYSDQVEYVMHGGEDPSGGYFMVGGQSPMDFKGFTDYLVESGMSRPMAIKEAGRYKSAGVAYGPEFTGEASSEATPYTTERATQKASDLINEANLLMERGGAENKKRAEELMKLAEKYRGSKGKEFRKVVASGSTAPDPSMMSFLGGLSRMEGPERD